MPGNGHDGPRCILRLHVPPIAGRLLTPSIYLEEPRQDGMPGRLRSAARFRSCNAVKKELLNAPIPVPIFQAREVADYFLIIRLKQFSVFVF